MVAVKQAAVPASVFRHRPHSSLQVREPSKLQGEMQEMAGGERRGEMPAYIVMRVIPMVDQVETEAVVEVALVRQ